ncbi:hypothetical protein RUM44_008258 [Polyplax serrata]|uniref:TNF receptor-associated factor 4 n=1 Tax=Polyplax serrata TaxID=468196 RepID=A0ABR1B7X6_POLSC
MVRSLTQWAKTLSFPSRLTPQKSSTTSVTPPGSEVSIFSSIPAQVEEHIYTEPNSEKIMVDSTVYCIHHKKGCQWSDELRKLKAHLNTCKYDTLPCRNNCGAQIPRVLMEDHMKYTCPQRRTQCEFCGKDFIGATLELHLNKCNYEPIYCENKCGHKIQRRLIHQHKAADCSKRLVPCRYCTNEFIADTLQVHHSKCGRFPVTCPNRCDSGLLCREELESHLKEECTSLVACCPFKEAGCRFISPRFNLDKHLEEQTKQHLTLMSSLVVKQQQQISTLKSALSKLSLNYSGTLLWKISDFAAKLAEAKSKDGVELVSPPFYTSQYGYKLQASAFLNGNGAGESTHLSVYIKILPGEYDALLRWPFSHSVSFTIFDQTQNTEKACNVVESFIPDPTWKNFLRPSKEPDSLGFGFPRFISHDLLNKRFFIRDDTLFIRVKVDPAKNFELGLKNGP